MTDPTTLLFGLLFGAIGAGYIVYGKKQQMGMPLFSGVALCIIPYFTSNVTLLIFLGLVLAALPFFVKV